MKIRRFIELAKLSMNFTFVETVTQKDGNSKYQSYKYEIELKFKRRKARFDYYISILADKDPDIEEFLYIMKLDSDVVNYRSFEDWCNEFGYDTDSRRALEIYNDCHKNARKMKKLLGDALFEQFMTCEE